MATSISTPGSRIFRILKNGILMFFTAVVLGYLLDYRHKPVDSDLFGTAIAIAIGGTAGVVLFDFLHARIKRYQES